MRRRFRRFCYFYGFPPWGFYGRFGMGLGQWWYKMSREEEKEYLEELKEELEEELEKIKKRLEELK